MRSMRPLDWQEQFVQGPLHLLCSDFIPGLGWMLMLTRPVCKDIRCALASQSGSHCLSSKHLL